MTAALGVTTAGAADATANSINLSDRPEDVTLTTPIVSLPTAAPATTAALTTGMVRNLARNSTHVLFASVAKASGTRSRAELPISGE